MEWLCWVIWVVRAFEHASDPVLNVVMASWVYWLLELRGRGSLLIAVDTWSCVVARAVKQVSAMVVALIANLQMREHKIRDSWSTGLAILSVAVLLAQHL